jgi:hypothetical protein
MTQPMMASELVATGEARHRPRWMRPLLRAMRWSNRSVRFWKTSERPVPRAAAENMRNLDRIRLVGVRAVGRMGAPDMSPWSAHHVAIGALAELKAGLLNRGARHE